MKNRGFTFLEVMVSLAIMAMALTALSGITANSFDASNYSKFLTLTTFLARSKMIDVEEELRKDGFGDSEKEYSGDFSDEGYPGIKWVAVCRPIEVDIGQMFGSLLGGDVNPENLSENVQTYVEALSGEAGGELSEEVDGSELGQMMGGEALAGVFKQVGETLKNSIREITLEITWKSGPKFEESVKYVQYTTTTGRLATPAGFQPPRSNLANAPGQRNAQTLQGTIGGTQPTLKLGTSGGSKGKP